jgi:hypothetical protein
MLIGLLLSPTGLDHAWYFPPEGHIAEANPAQPEFPDKGPGAAADGTPVVLSGIEFRLSFCLGNQ